MNKNNKLKKPLSITLLLVASTLYTGHASASWSENVTAEDNVIHWQQDGAWYQVENTQTGEIICQGGTTCRVSDGVYRVIRFRPGGSGSDRTTIAVSEQTSTNPTSVTESAVSLETQSPVQVTGSTISWPDDGWYQVQRSDNYQTMCEGGNSCRVEPGLYNVVNLSTRTRYDNIQVTESFELPPAVTQDDVNSENVLQLLIQALEVPGGNAFDQRVHQPMVDVSSLQLNDREIIRTTASSESYSCTNGGTLDIDYSSDDFIIEARSYDNCQINADTYNGDVSRSYNPIQGHYRTSFSNYRVDFSFGGHMTASGRLFDCCDQSIDRFEQIDLFSSDSTRFNYFLTYYGGTLSVENAFWTNNRFVSTNSNTQSKDLRVDFKMTPPFSEQTFSVSGNFFGSQSVSASTEVPFTIGSLRIRSDNDSSQVLVNAATGDDSTVLLLITDANGVNYAPIILDWSLLSDALVDVSVIQND